MIIIEQQLSTHEGQITLDEVIFQSYDDIVG
jgi:hypothetical protein